MVDIKIQDIPVGAQEIGRLVEEIGQLRSLFF
jgi:hypothetical protein